MSKKLLVSVRHRAGEVTAMAILSTRDSMLSPDKNELIFPGEFSLSKRPDDAAALDVTPELVERLKNFVAELENGLVAEPEAVVEAKEEVKIEEDPKSAKSKEPKSV